MKEEEVPLKRYLTSAEPAGESESALDCRLAEAEEKRIIIWKAEMRLITRATLSTRRARRRPAEGIGIPYW